MAFTQTMIQLSDELASRLDAEAGRSSGPTALVARGDRMAEVCEALRAATGC